MAFQPLLQIHHHKGYRNCRFRCQSQLAHDPGQTEAPFTLTELALNRYPVVFFLAGLQFDLPPLFNLGRRPAQRGTRKTDAMLRAILAVTPGAVDLVRMNGCRIITKALARGFDLVVQITGFVIGIPTDAIHKRKPIDQACRHLGAKFG